MKETTALARWMQLDGLRSGFMRRVEGYASVTIPKIMLPLNVNQNSESIQHDVQSVGAQAVNHVTNKIILALFSPGNPFFRVDPNTELMNKLLATGVTEAQVRESLVGGEQRALRILDQRAVRPKLNEAVKNLVVTGNVLQDLSDKELARMYGLREYVVKRSISGKPAEIIIHEKLMFDELEEDAQAATTGKQDDSIVSFLKWYKRKGKQWTMTQHVDAVQLPDAFNGRWSEADFPIYPLTWDLADKHDYGTGLVEDYAGDFGSLSTLSEAEIKAALLASEFRWLADPSGITDVSLFKESSTGDVLPGRKTDLTLVSLTGASAIADISASADKIIRRIGSAFLLNSAVTRNAERVTAEEIRMQAQELETALGGVYSRLAVDMQLPLAKWLLAAIDVKLNGTDLVPTIVTGLDALSRNAEATQLALFLSDLNQVAVMAPELSGRLKLSEVIATMAAARGISASKFVKTEEQYAADQAAIAAQTQEAAERQIVTEQGAKALANSKGTENATQ